MQSTIIPAGATIFQAGDPSVAIYVIEDGEVAISVGDPGSGIEVARLHAGALFGESGVLEARARAATATAVTTTTLLVTEAELFKQAFGMDNDRALSLVKLLCARLRSTTLRVAKNEPAGIAPAMAARAAIELLPAHARLTAEFAMKPLRVDFLPFQVGNRFGGETVPIASNRSFCIPARGDLELSAPHFEILRRGGVVGIRDLGSRDGTIVNGALLNRASLNPVAALHKGDNEVVAGRAKSPFRFLIRVPDGS